MGLVVRPHDEQRRSTYQVRLALVAQLDRAPDYESGGREFESSPARHFGSKVRPLYAADCAPAAIGIFE